MRPRTDRTGADHGPAPSPGQGQDTGRRDALIDGLDLGGYYLFHAVRADLLRRLGRSADAEAAYEAALALTGNAAERAYLAARLAETGMGMGAG